MYEAKPLNTSSNKIDESKNTTWQKLDPYIFILWDGLEFFGFSIEKLSRLRGIKAKYSDKFTNRKNLAKTIAMISLIVYVISGEAAMIGDIKS